MLIQSLISTSYLSAYAQKIKLNHKEFLNKEPQVLEELQLDLEGLFNRTEEQAWIPTLNLIIAFCERFPTVYASHAFIAKQVGIHRDTAQRLVKKLELMGFIATCFRGIKKTLYYKISPIFKRKDIRMRLKHWLPALRFIPFVMLFAAQNKAHIKPDVGQLRDSYILNPVVVGCSEFYSSSTITSKVKKGTLSTTPTPSKEEERGIPSRSELMKPDWVIPGCRLTVWGRIKLAAYPREAIEFAISRIRPGHNLNKPFQYVLKLANQWCKDNNQVPNWKRFYEIAEALEMPLNAPDCIAETTSNPVSFGKRQGGLPKLDSEEELEQRNRRECLQRQQDKKDNDQVREAYRKRCQDEWHNKSPQERGAYMRRILEITGNATDTARAIKALEEREQVITRS